MTFTSEERREVAERLWRQARWMNKNKDWYDKDDVDQGNRAYRNIADSVEEGSNFSNHYEKTVRKLADLIDRPTCKPKDRGRGYVDAVCDSFCCPNCGFEIDVHIGEEQHLTEAAKYCPNCGAEVQE